MKSLFNKLIKESIINDKHFCFILGMFFLIVLLLEIKLKPTQLILNWLIYIMLILDTY